MDYQNPDSQPSQPKRSLPRRKDARLDTYSRSQAPSSTSKPFQNIPYISQIPNIMRPFVEEIVNVKRDSHCGFRVIAVHLGMDEEDHVLIRQALIHELRNHKSDYMSVFGGRICNLDICGQYVTNIISIYEVKFFFLWPVMSRQLLLTFFCL